MRRPARGSNGAQVVGVLFVLGGLLGAISLVLPHPASGDLEIWGVVVVAVLVGVSLVVWRAIVPHWLLHATVAFGALLVNVMALASGVAAGVYAGMFCWVVLVSVNFFSIRSALVHFAWMIGTFAVVLTIVESSGEYSALNRWLTTTMALAVTGAAGAWLVFRRRLAEEEVQRFMNLSEEMLCTIDSGGRFGRLNSAWERSLGYPLPQLYATRVVDLVHPGDLAETEAALASLRDGMDSLTLQNRCRGQNGGWHELLWSASFADEETMIYARVKPARARSAPDPLDLRPAGVV